MDGVAQGSQMPRGGFPGGGPPGGMAAGRLGATPGGPLAGIVIVALLAVTLLILAFAFYKLYAKAGFSGAIGLLMLVPIVNLGVALYLAYATWPIQTELQRVKLVAASANSSGAGSLAPSVLVSPAHLDGP